MKISSLEDDFIPIQSKKNVFNSDDFLESYDSLDLVYILDREILRQYRRETISLWNAFCHSQTNQIDAGFFNQEAHSLKIYPVKPFY